MAIKLSPEQLEDYEFMTPAQAAEARRMKSELPLWQEMENMPPSDEHHAYITGHEFASYDSVSLDAMPHATQALDGLDSTIGGSNGQSSINAPPNVSGEFFPYKPDAAKMAEGHARFLADIELHRALNGTQGQESEQ